MGEVKMTIEETADGSIVLDSLFIHIYDQGDTVCLIYTPDNASLFIDSDDLGELIAALKMVQRNHKTRRLKLEDWEKLARWGKAPTPTPVKDAILGEEEYDD